MGLFNLMTCKNIMTVLTLARIPTSPTCSFQTALTSPVYHKKIPVLAYLISTRPAKKSTHLNNSAKMDKINV